MPKFLECFICTALATCIATGVSANIIATQMPEPQVNYIILDSNDVVEPDDDEIELEPEEDPEQQDYENELIELALFEKANLIENCTVTAYCPCSKCCGKWANGITATGTTATPWSTVAVDPKVIPLGSEVMITTAEGETIYCRAEDTGVTGNHIDLFMADHSTALLWGLQKLNVRWIPPYEEEA